MELKLFSIFIFLTITLFGVAQIGVVVSPDSLATQPYFDIDDTYSSKESLIEQLTVKRDSLQRVGFLAASVDTILMKDSIAHLKLFLGDRLNKFSVSNGNLEDQLYSTIFNKEEYTWEQLEQKRNAIVSTQMEKGFIQTKAYYKEFEFDNTIRTKIYVEKGSEAKLDSIYIEGNAKISSNYIYNLLQLKQGDILSQKQIDRIKRAFKNAKFLNLQQPPGFRFKDDGYVDVYLNLDERKSNEFDLLIGLLPNPNPQLSEANLLVTGQGNLVLLNPFGGGRELAVDYKQIQPESPILDAGILLPNILNRNFGAIGEFNLNKQDSSFVNLIYGVGLNYQIDGKQTVSIGYESTDSYLQTIDTTFVKQTRQLPPSADYNQSIYKITYELNTLNSYTSPSNGWQVTANAGIGNRTIEENLDVRNLTDGTGFDFSTLYLNINDKKTVVDLLFNAKRFLPISKGATVLLESNTSVKRLSNYFENDLYRLGGIQSLRGFDERSILASSYTAATAEYRLFLNRESFFSVFADGGYITNDQLDTNETLFGVGSGLNLSTKAGIFSLNLAVGKREESSFDFNKTRIHFGYVNVF